MARHYHRSPDLLSPPEIEAYLLHLVKDRKPPTAASTTLPAPAASCLRPCWGAPAASSTCARPWPVCHRSSPSCSRAKRSRTCLPAARIRFTEPCCKTIYAAGLRISEACALRVDDIDSAPDRMCVRVTAGKGGADR
ncbi:hypothetical protein [Candidatus Aalborgicola defluviihabitans]|uniref:hypothetical protein n=1 Tax=Candidatus Aalborgicola defluviihabitans TaxID=3386187 RepID=UPI0039B968D6